MHIGLILHDLTESLTTTTVTVLPRAYEANGKELMKHVSLTR